MQIGRIAAAIILTVGLAGCSDGVDVFGQHIGARTPISAEPGISPEPGVSTTDAPTDSRKPHDIQPRVVDADRFAQGGGQPDGVAYFFQSPTGNLKCGIYTDGALKGVGCQAKQAPRPHGKKCEAWMNPSISIINGVAEHVCQTQGIYVGPPAKSVQPDATGSSEGGGEMLSYGEAIVVGDTTCASAVDGITCRSGPAGFRLSRAAAVVF